MVYLSASPELDAKALTLFQTSDPRLSDAPIILFRGPASSVAGPNISSSRIQCHIFTSAGFQSYSRLALSPSSPLYAAVSCLSREDQGDEICRELAYCLYKYFAELPQEVKDVWVQTYLSAKKPATAFDLFTESHAADLASRMKRVEDVQCVIDDIRSALASKEISYIDADVTLPTGTISEIDTSSEWEEESTKARFGKYADLIGLLGNAAFLPTSRMRRAPSRPVAANHSVKFSRAQKEALRREMCEFVDTEESYINKLHELVDGVASNFRSLSRYSGNGRTPDDEQLIATLFPPTLDEVFATNSAFLGAIRDLFDQTEQSAIDDLERQDAVSHTDSSSTDPIGATAFAKCLLDYIPKFKAPYEKYILARQNMNHSMKSVLHQQGSLLATKILEVGEKRLMSLLIEPVQRLPRYSLYIENMTKQLSTRHPALRMLLKAKDAIADICAQDLGEQTQSKSLLRLKRLVQPWPSACQPKTRIITAIDLVELQPPYNIDSQPRETSSFIGLLFADTFVLIQNNFSEETNARSLLGDIESHTKSTWSNNAQENDLVLQFADWTPLDNLKVTEMNQGQLIHTIPSRLEPNKSASRGLLGRNICVFYPCGMYEGRAARFTKELIKARIEGRYSEKERESAKWQARELESTGDRLGAYSAIFEEGRLTKASHRGLPAQTRIIVDPEKHKARGVPSALQADVVASLTVAGNGFYRLEVDSLLAPKTKDFVTSGELISVLFKRLLSITQMRGSVRNPTSTTFLLQHYDGILRSLRLTPERLGRSPSRSKSIRQHSPVKAIANFFGGTGKSNNEIAARPTAAQAFSASVRTNLGPKSLSEPVFDDKPSSPIKASASTIVTNDNARCMDTAQSLEAALETFVLALRARKGNIIGRVIANRSSAEDAAVDQLCNGLCEQPQNHEQAAHAPVDVLFAAFERFLKIPWREKFGPVLDNDSLDEMQRKSSELLPMDYEEYLLKKIDDLVPQNQRALKGVVGLLIDLLDGTGNDGDRGSLMATITEMTVCEGDPHAYMPLFDRLVEESEVILHSSHSFTSHGGSTATRSSHAHSGSLSSKASSWGKRLGLGSLGRKNSKADTSFTSQSATSTSRGILDRTRSFDWSKSASPLSRPGSRDRPKAALDATPENSRPGTGKSADRVEPLESLRESGAFRTSSVPRKKRRSSLSDLDTLPKVNTSPFWGSPTPRRPGESPSAGRHGGSPLRQETPSILSRPRPRLDFANSLAIDSSPTPFLGRAAQSGEATVTPAASPVRSNAVRHRSPTKKENVPPTGVISDELSPPPSSTLHRAQTSPSRRHQATPSVAPSKAPLTERAGSGNTPPPLSINTSRANSDKETAPSKLRTPSPSPVKTLSSRPRAKTAHATDSDHDRLANRIQDQKSAISQAESGLMAELAKIGAEISATSSTPARANSRRQEHMGGGGTGTTPRKENFEGRLRALETKVPHLFRNLSERMRTLEEDMDTQLRAKDDRIKELERALGV